MEERKQKEVEYYDEQALRQNSLAGQAVAQEDFFPVLGSQKFLYAVAGLLCDGKRVLDYGCGEGIHIPFLARHAREVIGVDLSEGSLAVARRRYLSRRQVGRIQLLKMDCEALTFPNQIFDVVFDGGTFSSLDFRKAIEEIKRVLKPDGVLVGIETFGHNPLANAKRAVNRLTGKRTAWAAAHIARQKELECLRRSFEQVEVFYFHLISLFAFPLLVLPGGRLALRFLEGIDRVFLRLPFFQKYAFKIVFVCKNVKKSV